MQEPLEKRDTRVQIVIVENGKYILLKHLAIKENVTFWGLAGGGQETGESEEEAALREAEEETGLKIKLLPIRLEKNLAQKRILYHRIVTFLAYPVSGTAATGYEPEADEYASYNYRLVGLKWQDFYDDTDLKPFTLESMVPIRQKLAEAAFVRKAAAMVVRHSAGVKEYLLVSARIDPDCRVFPQGHVDPGEGSEEAAIRETREEAGFEIQIDKKLGFFFQERNGTVYKTDLFLASAVREVSADEKRRVEWLTAEQVAQIMIPRESRRAVQDFEVAFKTAPE
ncbi:MAG: NUDIX hydrolase [Deltaproteobacteria bacterium]|nr:NUDIX hydrolase [Deltaproteobacteria bacterium]